MSIAAKALQGVLAFLRWVIVLSRGITLSKILTAIQENLTRENAKKFIRRQFYWSTIFRRINIIVSALLIVVFLLSPISPSRVRPAQAALPVLAVMAIWCVYGIVTSAAFIVTWGRVVEHQTWDQIWASPEMGPALGIACLLGPITHYALEGAVATTVVASLLKTLLDLAIGLSLGEVLTPAVTEWFSGSSEEIGNQVTTAMVNDQVDTFSHMSDVVNQTVQNSATYANESTVFINEFNSAYYSEYGEYFLVEETTLPLLPIINITDDIGDNIYQSEMLSVNVRSSEGELENLTDCTDTSADLATLSLFKYIEFGYAYTTNQTAVHSLPGIDVPDGKDWTGCNGFGIAADLLAAGFSGPTPIYLAARGLDSYDRLSPWYFSGQIIADPRNLHDYGLSNLQFTPSVPNDDDVVQVTATVQNLGASNESNVRIEFDVDGRFANSHYIEPLAAGASTTTSFSWTALQGAHTFTMRAELDTDENLANDSATRSLVVGTAPLVQVNGSAAPASLQISASTNGTSSNFAALVQNIGTASTSVTVSKGGAMASWIALPTSSFNLNANSNTNYSFSVNVPAGQSVGTYAAEIYFDWTGGSRITLPVEIQVMQYAVGNVTYNFTPSSGTVNGASAGILTRGSKSNVTLDNYTSTTYPINLTDSFSLTDSEYYRIPSDSSGEWVVNISEIQSESSLTGMYFDIGNFDITKVDNFSGSFSTFNQFLRGGNSFFIGLSNLGTYGNNTTWIINSSAFNIKQTASAWWDSLGYSPGDSTVNTWKAGWDYARICATVNSVTTAGSVTLFNDVLSVYTRSISSTDVGDEVCWYISSSEIFGSNHFNLRSTYNGANISLGNIYFNVHYYTGQPALQVQRSLSTQRASIDETVVATLNFTNVGSNIAEDPYYTENLPAGLTLLGGTLTGYTSDVDPNTSTSITYSFKGSTPGTYTIPGRIITYEDPANNNYFSVSNSTAFEIWGGTLLPVLEPLQDGEAGTPSLLTASVTDSLTSNAVNNATVIATITQPDDSTIQVVLTWDAIAGKYTAPFAPSAAGEHTIVLSATRLFYTPGSSASIPWAVHLQNQEPIAAASYQHIIDGDPLAVYLDGSSSLDVDGVILSYEWDIDQDGTPEVDGRKVDWTFLEAGTYTVDLKVTDHVGASDQTTVAVTVSEVSMLTRDFTLNVGWNLLGLAVTQPDLTAEELCLQATTAGVPISEIDRWYAGGWDSHICGLPFNDFPIVLGQGYFVRSNEVGEVEYLGTAYQGQLNIPIYAGWNLIAIPEGVSYTAESLLSQAGGICTEVDRWYAGGWDSHLYTLPFNDFNIEPGSGYFIKCSQQTSLIIAYP